MFSAAKHVVVGPVVHRLRQARAWVRDVRTHGAAGAREYWSDPNRPGWKANSHWRDAPVEGWSDAWSEIGATHAGMYERYARAQQLSPPRRILEWGVGGGANAVRFAPLAEEFIAVDISQDSLDEAERQVRATCDTRLYPILVALDDQAGPVEPLAGSIDLFFCFYVLELVPTEAHALEIVNIAFRALRPGGAAILQVKYQPSAPRRRAWTTFASRLANSYVVGIPEFWALLASVGFDVHYVELVPRNRLDRNYGYFFMRKPS